MPAYLNTEERQQLLDELKDKRFWRIKWKLNNIDPDGRLAYYRNAQRPDAVMSRWVLEGLGTQVTLVETVDWSGTKTKYNLDEIIVEPTPENNT